MFAVVKAGGKQYRVAAKDVITVARRDGEPGDAVAFDEVILFGDEGKTEFGAPGVAGVTVAALAVVLGFYRKLLFTTFDPEVADVSGVNTARMDALLMLLLSVSILATMKVLGVVLIAAILVIPAVVARMLTNSFARMLWLSTLVGAACGFTGMVLSYHLDVSSGASIVLVGAALFAVVFAVTGQRGRRRAAGLPAEHDGPALVGLPGR